MNRKALGLAALSACAAIMGLSSSTSAEVIQANLGLAGPDNWAVLTLNGAGLADAQFVINFSGSINLHGDDAGGKILLTGGLTTHDVIFNYVGAAGGTAIVSSGGSSNNIPNAIFSGVYLVTNSDVNLAPGEIDGEVIGGAAGYKITFASGSQAINPPTTSVPVPAALPAGLAGMAMMGVWKWRRQRKSQI